MATPVDPAGTASSVINVQQPPQRSAPDASTQTATEAQSAPEAEAQRAQAQQQVNETPPANNDSTLGRNIDTTA